MKTLRTPYIKLRLRKNILKKKENGKKTHFVKHIILIVLTKDSSKLFKAFEIAVK